jgi:hypothetical protein
VEQVEETIKLVTESTSDSIYQASIKNRTLPDCYNMVKKLMAQLDLKDNPVHLSTQLL